MGMARAGANKEISPMHDNRPKAAQVCELCEAAGPGARESGPAAHLLLIIARKSFAFRAISWSCGKVNTAREGGGAVSRS